MTNAISRLEKLLRIFDQQDEKIVHILRRFPPFQDLSDREIHVLAAKCHIRHFAAEEEIFAEQSPAAAIYFIVSGSVGLYKKRRGVPPDRLQAVKAGQFIGESVLIQPVPRSHSARALEKTLVVVLFQIDYKWLEAQHPGLALKILRLAAQKINRELQIFQSEFHELAHKIAHDQLLD